MEEPDFDPVGRQVLQAGLEVRHEDSPGLGGGLTDHDHLVPWYAFETGGEQALAVAVGVIVGGIEVVDTQVDGPGDDRRVGRETDAHPDRADLQSRFSQGSICNRRWRLKRDRKSTRLNSSHLGISYAVF